MHTLAIAMVVVLGPGPTDPRSGTKSPHRHESRIVRVHNLGTTIGEPPPGMVYVPGGSFLMGATVAETLELVKLDDFRHSETLVAMAPDHYVTVEDRFLDRFEVTNRQYRLFLADLALEPSAALIEFNWSDAGRARRGEPLPAEQELLPVRAITFVEARACARWLGKRLPTEAEWEHAARRKLDARAAFSWGVGWSAWDASKCANLDSSSRPGHAGLTFPGGSFSADVSTDGLFDLCGNVAEWTDSPFVAYPGHAPLEIVDRRHGKRKVTSAFDSASMVIRGGSAWGTMVSDNLLVRNGARPTDALEGVGFRCAASALAGLDAVRGAIDALALAHPGLRSKIDTTPFAFAGESIYSGDPKTGVGAAGQYLAFARVKEIAAPMQRVAWSSMDAPELLGVLATSKPLLAPPLPAGSYAIYFKGKGLTEAQKKELQRAGRHAPPPPSGGAVHETGAVTMRPHGILACPHDLDLLLFEDKEGEIVGWERADYSSTALHPTRIGVAAGTSAAPNDVATFAFSVKMGKENLDPTFLARLELAPGIFEPAAMPGAEVPPAKR